MPMITDGLWRRPGDPLKWSIRSRGRYRPYCVDKTGQLWAVGPQGPRYVATCAYRYTLTDRSEAQIRVILPGRLDGWYDPVFRDVTRWAILAPAGPMQWDRARLIFWADAITILEQPDPFIEYLGEEVQAWVVSVEPRFSTWEDVRHGPWELRFAALGAQVDRLIAWARDRIGRARAWVRARKAT